MTRRILVSRDKGVSIVSQPDPIRIVAGNRGSRGVAAKLGDPTGPYNAGTVYSQGMIVSSQGASWIYTNATPGSGNPPPTLPTQFNGHWQVVAKGGDRFDAALFIRARPRDAEMLLRLAFSDAGIAFPAGLPGSAASAAIAATATTVFALARNGTPFGTVTFAGGATTGVLAAASTTSFAQGDILTITAPDPRDATLADISITLTGNR